METTLTGDKTPEQLMRELQNTPWTIERQVMPETNLRELAATLSSKIEHKTVQEFLSDCDKIYEWLMIDKRVEDERKSERGRMAMERYRKFGCI